MGAEPATAAGVQQPDGVLTQIGEVGLDEVGIQQQVGTARLAFEAAPRSWCVDALRRRTSMHPELSGAEAFLLPSLLEQAIRLGRVSGGEEVATAVHVESIGVVAFEPLDQIDAAIHQAHHGVAGTGIPVAVTLHRLVASQRKRGERVHDCDIGDPALHTQVIGSGDSGNAGAADDHIGRVWSSTHGAQIDIVETR